MDYGTFQAVCSTAKDSQSPGRCVVQGDEGYILMESHPGECHRISLKENGKDAVELDRIPLGEPFANVYKRILPIVESDGYDTCYAMMEKVIEVMQVMEEARKNAGIQFSCD